MIIDILIKELKNVIQMIPEVRRALIIFRIPMNHINGDPDKMKKMLDAAIWLPFLLYIWFLMVLPPALPEQAKHNETLLSFGGATLAAFLTILIVYLLSKIRSWVLSSERSFDDFENLDIEAIRMSMTIMFCWAISIPIFVGLYFILSDDIFYTPSVYVPLSNPAARVVISFLVAAAAYSVLHIFYSIFRHQIRFERLSAAAITVVFTSIVNWFSFYLVVTVQ